MAQLLKHSSPLCSNPYLLISPNGLDTSFHPLHVPSELSVPNERQKGQIEISRAHDEPPRSKKPGSLEAIDKFWCTGTTPGFGKTRSNPYYRLSSSGQRRGPYR
eukprot:scaffold39773_cov24-Attheya_sp.AAC.1